jgi:hypothetical protein
MINSICLKIYKFSSDTRQSEGRKHFEIAQNVGWGESEERCQEHAQKRATTLLTQSIMI